MTASSYSKMLDQRKRVEQLVVAGEELQRLQALALASIAEDLHHIVHGRGVILVKEVRS